MKPDQPCFEHDLAELDASLRRGDVEAALLELATFELALSGYVRGEERVVFAALEHGSSALQAALSMMRREHASLRQLVATLREALDTGDLQRGLHVLCDLRSVLALHITKEDRVFSASGASAAARVPRP